MPLLRTSLENLQKARAICPGLRPWRCHSESDLIRRLTWQWEHKRAKYGFSDGSKRGLARRLGVSQTWVQKLCREYRQEPGKLQIIVLRRGMATIDELRMAKESTQQMRSRGQLRRRIRWHKKRKWDYLTGYWETADRKG